MRAAYDVIVVGGGHNGLVAAAYLARAGRRVIVLEARSVFGGAVAGQEVFPGVAARLSRYAYLVSLLPRQVCADLGLRLQLRSRRVASYTPYGSSGLLIERPAGSATRASFRAMTGGDEEYRAWLGLEGDLAQLADVVAPTLTRPLPRADEMAAAVGPEVWTGIVERPLGELLESRLRSDVVRGVLLTDALIGTFTFARDPSLRQNRCFLYHVIGDGTGEWQVPVGGMGAVVAALVEAAQRWGAELRVGHPVVGIALTDGGVEVTLAHGNRLEAPTLLAGCAPATLRRLLGHDEEAPEGSQLKVNLMVRRLPRLRSGLDPETAFAGTLHLHQGYDRLAEAYAEAEAGRLPDPLPAEVYCHTLTDASILSPELRASGAHTLSMFGLLTPRRLFTADPYGARKSALAAALRSLQDVLAEPLEDCLMRDADGRPCVEVITPPHLEDELAMPGGHIFHGDLDWPWLGAGETASTPAERWGVATSDPRILLCGSGARRGGAVSGLGGHNAAMAVLEGG